MTEQVFGTIATVSGFRVARVLPDIAEQRLPAGNMLRWKQSNIDFATAFAGSIKVMEDEAPMLKRGSPLRCRAVSFPGEAEIARLVTGPDGLISARNTDSHGRSDAAGSCRLPPY